MTPSQRAKVKEALEMAKVIGRWKRNHAQTKEAQRHGRECMEKAEEALALLASAEQEVQAEKPSYEDLMRAVYIYQQRTGQTLEDTLAGKWTNPAPLPASPAMRSAEDEKATAIKKLQELSGQIDNYRDGGEEDSDIGYMQSIVNDLILSVSSIGGVYHDSPTLPAQREPWRPPAEDVKRFIEIFDTLSQFEAQQRYMRGYGALDPAELPDGATVRVMKWLHELSVPPPPTMEGS
jgi:hypothetical protein